MRVWGGYMSAECVCVRERKRSGLHVGRAGGTMCVAEKACVYLCVKGWKSVCIVWGVECENVCARMAGRGVCVWRVGKVCVVWGVECACMHSRVGGCD